MARLVFVDTVGGSLSALGAAMARVEGAPGFDEVVARTKGEVRLEPVVGTVLAEVGLHLTPSVKPFAPELLKPEEGDVVITLGDGQVDGSLESWPFSLAPEGAEPLVQRSTARTTRDALARKLAAFCAQRGLRPLPDGNGQGGRSVAGRERGPPSIAVKKRDCPLVGASLIGKARRRGRIRAWPERRLSQPIEAPTRGQSRSLSPMEGGLSPPPASPR